MNNRYRSPTRDRDARELKIAATADHHAKVSVDSLPAPHEWVIRRYPKQVPRSPGSWTMTNNTLSRLRARLLVGLVAASLTAITAHSSAQAAPPLTTLYSFTGGTD